MSEREVLFIGFRVILGYFFDVAFVNFDLVLVEDERIESKFRHYLNGLFIIYNVLLNQ